MSENIERREKKKKLNEKILKMMYYGDPNAEWKCLISGKKLVVYTKNFITGEIEKRWHGQFDHTRESPGGGSIDKNGTKIQDKWRGSELSLLKDKDAYLRIFEFMNTIVMHHDTHHDKTSDVKRSSKTFTLNDHEPENYPWFLKSQENFNKFCDYVGLKNLKYKIFLKHLQDPEAPSIYKCEWVKDILPVIGPLFPKDIKYIQKQWYTGKEDTTTAFCKYYAKHYNTSEGWIKKVIENCSTEKRDERIKERQTKSDQQWMDRYWKLKEKRTRKITMSDFDRRNNIYVGFTSKVNRSLAVR
tara:strand:- start:107 stop:1006 length:900 start_codon:yes stop_codon:yes gene_type:complete